MSLSITPEQVDFEQGASRWASARALRSTSRRLLNEEDAAGEIVERWRDVTELGWTGLLIPESLGGGEASWLDAAILVEALAAECSPLPLVGTLATSALLARSTSESAQLLVKGVVAGAVRIGIATSGRDPWRVIGGQFATHIAVVDEAPEGDVAIFDVKDCQRTERRLLDPTTATCEVRSDGDPVLTLSAAATEVRDVLRLLWAADALGVSNACLTMAVDYAGVREAFGRPIGSFQAVKHHCANMLIRSQLASAATWRAATAQGTADATKLTDVAAFLAAKSALACAKTGLQIMGGIGFTWEHDAHLFLRRAGMVASLLGPPERIASATGESRLRGARPVSSITLPPEADPIRSAVSAFRERVLATPEPDRHALIVDEGYLQPHWPAPWGRAANPLEQLVIEETLHDIDRTSALGSTYWEIPIILPTVLDHGSDEQIHRWMRPSMMGELKWCQLFSEPSAGSDLAALRTRAVKVEGGWLVTGQKVWTSDAHHADMGMALVRTDPEAKKHKGITCMMLDMHSPGVDIRPLRQISGESHFNEVFLDEVFVPDENVLGPVNAGWTVARTTLGHERVSLGAASSVWTRGDHWELVVDMVRESRTTRPDLVRQLGEIVITEEGAAALNLRSAYRALVGQGPGVDGTISKTVVAELAQTVGDFGLDVVGDDAAFTDGPLAGPPLIFLHVRMTTIAGGTSEVLRNVLAEQALGLPREPSLT